MLSRLCQYVTLLLGMKPGQHEYKVMGLAPYETSIMEEGLDFFEKLMLWKGTKYLIKTQQGLILFILRRSPGRDLMRLHGG